MLTEIYIEALLAIEELADQVWEAWEEVDPIDWTAWQHNDNVGFHLKNAATLSNQWGPIQ